MQKKKSTPVELQRAREVHERIGRNVIRGQFLELALKTLVPLIDPKGGPTRLNERRENARKQTLGKLVETFQSRLIGENDELTALVARVVDGRNDLIHHFPSKFGALSRTPEGHAKLLQILDEQFHEMKMLEKSVNYGMLQVLGTLRDRQQADSVRYAEFASIHAEWELFVRAWWAPGD